MNNLVPCDLWGQSSGHLGVSGESHHEKELRRVLGGSVPAGGREVTTSALLVADPRNRYDRNAVKVMVDQMQVGFLPADRCAKYGPVLAHLERHGRVARVRARVRGYSFTDYDERGRQHTRVGASVSLALADPHLLLPLTAQPEGPSIELPEGRRQKVIVDDSMTDHLSRWTQPEGSGWVHTSLVGVIDDTTRAHREVVAVQVEGRDVGRLTPAMSKNFLPLIALARERGLLCLARGLLSGNRVRCELSIAAAKASEVADSWLASEIYAVPALATIPGTDEHPGASARQEDDLGVRAAGFYPDPQDVADLRYWDGQAWTTRVRMNPRGSA